MTQNEVPKSLDEQPGARGDTSTVAGLRVQLGQSETFHQPPGVVPPRGASSIHATEPPAIWPGSEPKSPTVFESLEGVFGGKAYGAPRVFDLFTLLAVTLAFALLFGAIRSVEPILLIDTGVTTLAISLFLTGIAVGQLLLWSGKLPRLASIVAGPIMWVLIGVGICVLSTNSWPQAIFGVVCSAPLGVLVGYLGGAVVAGVFLIADAIRTKLLVRPKTQERDVEFDQMQ